MRQVSLFANFAKMYALHILYSALYWYLLVEGCLHVAIRSSLFAVEGRPG